MTAPCPAVFDCNVFLQAILSTRGPSHACWQNVMSGRVLLFVAPFMLAELRTLPEHRKLRRFTQLTPARVERFVDELLDDSQTIADPAASFVYHRDPQDARYVDAAVATRSLLIVSNDRDLLDLMGETNADGLLLRREHPGFAVLAPPDFLRALALR